MDITVHVALDTLSDEWKTPDEIYEDDVCMDASEQAFLDQLHAAIKAAYPGYNVAVVGDGDYDTTIQITPNADIDVEQMKIDIRAIEADIYDSQSWVVDVGKWHDLSDEAWEQLSFEEQMRAQAAGYFEYRRTREPVDVDALKYPPQGGVLYEEEEDESVYYP